MKNSLDKMLIKRGRRKEISSKNSYYVFQNSVKPIFTSFKIIFFYSLAGLSWVLFSDKILNILIKDTATILMFQTIKGFFYVLATSILLYILIHRNLKQIESRGKELIETYEKLEKTEEQLRTKYIELKKHEEEIRFLAYYDQLTGLYNRVYFERKVIDFLKDNTGNGVLILLDIDDFKKINDTLGHSYGDELLKCSAKLLEICVPSDTLLCRMSGDEFLIFIKGESCSNHAKGIMETILKKFREPMIVHGKINFLTISVGAALYPGDSTEYDSLLKYADAAMYKAKQSGKNKYSIYSKTISEEINKKIVIEQCLKDAITNNELHIHYQPQYDLKSGKIDFVEALLRWDSPVLGKVSPLTFIPIAEQTGLINEIGEWVNNTVCKQLREWIDKGLQIRGVAINISTIQLENNNFYDNLLKSIEDNNISPKSIEIEITENVVMNNIEDKVKLFAKLKEKGFNIALDDFGTGYSSLNYLKMLPISTLKIDKSFIDNMCVDCTEQEIIESIIRLATTLGVKVVVEGVETEEQYNILKTIGCDSIQGYFFYRPMLSEDIERVLS